jgi:hypothetical protein
MNLAGSRGREPDFRTDGNPMNKENTMKKTAGNRKSTIPPHSPTPIPALIISGAAGAKANS